MVEEAVTRHAETIHYSVLAGIQVGGENGTGSGTDTGFWLVVLEGFSGKKLRKRGPRGEAGP